eukprot:TRINITY_DN105451_c0_g1_i1.p1 TRINITY_DN105451_c0_g1~~TRINITY_DN105451_c0_g1_i1.p1  ORF type:complete len:1618 (+),score=328.70 TRINITY_DN105451_c0_g1_i1:51-4904(+)
MIRSLTLESRDAKPQSSYMNSVLRRFGLQSREETWKVLHFLTAAFLSNTVFVIGRNVGTTLFMHCPSLGERYLASAIFVSGLFTVLGGSVVSRASIGVPPHSVYRWLLLISSAILFLLYAETLYVFKDEETLSSAILYFAIYLAEDFIAMFVAMQCATVAQAAFNVSEAKRLFGLVQLGNSLAAMFVGLNIGTVAVELGTELLLVVQAVVLFISALQNDYIARTYFNRDGGSGGKKKALAFKNAAAAAADPWWRNMLVLAMGLWSFTVIAVKTIFEYQFNVLVAVKSSEDQMVALTGYLYAGAGIVATVVNLVGSRVCLNLLGMQGAILATPGCLLAVSAAIFASLSVSTTFAGRLVDLSLRWSINNTVRSVLWIAVPNSQAMAAKPWVEGTVKKLGSAFNAVLITATLALTGQRLWSLSLLSMVLTGLLFACCIRVHVLYMNSMWLRIKRREVRNANPWDSAAQEGPVRENQELQRRLQEKLASGKLSEQLYIVREMGDVLSDEVWQTFFVNFHELPTSVQVRVLELGKKNSSRVPSDFILKLIIQPSSPAVTTAAILVAGDRKLNEALTLLEVHLGSHHASVRAAAAACILKIGWGVGLGVMSSNARYVLEVMLGPQKNGEPPLLRVAPRQQLRTLVQAVSSPSKGSLARARSNSPTESLDWTSPFTSPLLQEHEDRPMSESMLCLFDSDVGDALPAQRMRLEREWEGALAVGNTSLAVSLAIQLTHVRAELLQQGSVPKSQSRSSCFSIDRAQERRSEEQATALEMLHQLPQMPAQAQSGGVVSGAGGLLLHSAWFELLQSSSHKVQIAALAFVCEEDSQQPSFQEELSLVVQCLGTQETYTAAEDALYRLCQQWKRVGETVQEQFNRQAQQLQNKRQERMSRQQPASLIAGLLKFLQRSCGQRARGRCSESALQDLLGGNLCDNLLEQGKHLSDADLAQQLLGTLLDLKGHGFDVTRKQAEEQLQEMAKQILCGLAVQQWVRRLQSLRLTENASQQLSGISRNLTVASPGGDVEERGDSPGRGGVRLAVEIALRYIDEHIYLQRLQLLQLSVLASPSAVMASTRVLAAWRVLRSKDARSEVAVLEVIDSLLPSALSEIVRPLLDTSPLDEKLREGRHWCKKHGFDDFADSMERSAQPPKWLKDWFMLPGEKLGEELGDLCVRYHDLTRLPASDQLRQPLSPQSDAKPVLPKVLLLFSKKEGIYAQQLSIYAAEIATVTEVISRQAGERLGKHGETYIVVQGTFLKKGRHEREFVAGDVIQELHSLCKELAPWEVECTSKRATLLRIREADIFELMFSLPPKFALGILRSVVELLPAPESTGGARACRRQSNHEPSGVLKRKASGLDSETFLGARLLSPGPASPHPQPTNVPELQLEKGVEEYDEEEDGAVDEEEQVDEEAEEDALASFARAMEHDETREQDTNAVASASQSGDEADGQGLNFVPPRRSCRSEEPFTMLEKLILLSSVKIFRYVPLEYLPFVAEVCIPRFFEKGQVIFEQDTPTGATLYIVAEGFESVDVLRDDVSERKLGASDSMGNTGLLHDTQWQYTARALEDTWVLCLEREGLTDLLRGRRELASAVIRGLYKTLRRRMCLVEALETGHPRQSALSMSFA